MAITVLITGATSGIGKELAELFAADGHRLVLAARSEYDLNQVKHELRTRHSAHITIIPVDLANSDATLLLIDTLDRESIEIDVLVNNAGFGLYGPFAETP